jgi:hypothetical protein
MFARARVLGWALLVAIAPVTAGPVWGQSASSGTNTILNATEAAKLLPGPVFFRGQSAPVQGRNSGGIKFGDGMLVLAALIDTSGYSSAVQQKYQAYFITEVAIEINRHPLAPGAYGVGFVGGNFGVMDIGAHDLFSVAATRDSDLKRPTPLQFIAGGSASEFRLYQGRDYVVITAPHQ